MKRSYIARLFQFTCVVAISLVSAVSQASVINTYQIDAHFLNASNGGSGTLSFDVATNGCTTCGITDLVSTSPSNVSFNGYFPTSGGLTYITNTLVPGYGPRHLTSFGFDASALSIQNSDISFNDVLYFSSSDPLNPHAGATIYSNLDSGFLVVGATNLFLLTLNSLSVQLLASTPVPSPVPLPPSIVLLASGLIGLFLKRRSQST